MCDHCVMEAVKDRMLSRRSVITGAAGATAALSSGLTGTAALADGHGSVRDMTHAYDDTFPTFDGDPGVTYEQVFTFQDNGFNLLNLSLREHTGTHIDAPLHFSADGTSVDALPVGNLVVPLCVVDVREKADADADAQVTPEDLDAWIAAHGDIPDRACVAMHSGWDKKVREPAFRGADDAGVLHFPGFHPEATAMLLETTSASALAVDTLSLDHGPSQDFATHYAWLPAGRYGIENIAGLDQVPAAGATLVVGAPTHRGGTGGPARVFAMV